METIKMMIQSKLNIPAALTSWAEDLKEQAGVFTASYQGQYAYLLAAGACPTGGYRIVAEPCTDRAGSVTYRIEGPSPDDFVIQMITYPYELILSEHPLQFSRLENGRSVTVKPQAVTSPRPAGTENRNG